MTSPELYNPEQWTNFFLLVGTGSAALAGLVFVAMTIDIKGIAKDATHRFRAINMLSGFTSAFVISTVALMGNQTHATLGVEWFALALLAFVINTNGYIQAYRRPGSLYKLSLIRIIGGSACYFGQVLGAALLYFGYGAGIYVSAVALVVNFYFLISGSWLLVMGTLPDKE